MGLEYYFEIKNFIQQNIATEKNYPTAEAQKLDI